MQGDIPRRVEDRCGQDKRESSGIHGGRYVPACDEELKDIVRMMRAAFPDLGVVITGRRRAPAGRPVVGASSEGPVP